MKPEQLLKIMNQSQLSLKQDIREMLQDSNIGIHAKIIDEVDKIDVKIDSVLNHQERQNNMLGKHEESLKSIEVEHAKVTTYQDTCPAAKVSENWKLIVGISLILMFLSNYVYANVHWLTVLDWIKKIL